MWQQVCALLQDPSRVAQEYQRRLQEPQQQESRTLLEAQASKLKQGLSRLIDGYAEGLIDKQEFQPRVERSKEKLQKVEQALRALAEEEAQQQELRLVVRYLEDFGQRVTDTACSEVPESCSVLSDSSSITAPFLLPKHTRSEGPFLRRHDPAFSLL